MSLPFDGAISAYFENDAPDAIRKAIKRADKDDILTDSYPFDERLSRKHYERDMERLQIELVKLQAWARDSGTRIACVFEGRDAAGKGGTISRFRANLNPRAARVVALSKPTETERTQWYFQRYISHLPAAGEMVFFDRSWYNRAGVERVMGFCTEEQVAEFMRQVPEFEDMLTNSGTILYKFWFSVRQDEQERRFKSRETDPLKQWKLSKVDLASRTKWDEYTDAREDMFKHTNTASNPWILIKSDDKKRARINCMRFFLANLDYPDKDSSVIGLPDPLIVSQPPQIIVDDCA